MYVILCECCIHCVDPPMVTIDPPQSPYMVNVGKRLLLYCIAEGFPIPTIQWYEDNISIPRQSSQVYLASTAVQGTTVYTCEGRNNAGNKERIARASIIVIVKSMHIAIMYVCM